MNDPKGRTYQFGKRYFVGNSRANKMANNNLGIIPYGSDKSSSKFRQQGFDTVEKYLENRQYDHLAPWQECCSTDTYVAIRKRKPSVIFPFAKTLQDRVAAKLVGNSTFPRFKIEDSENDNFFLQEILKTSFFKAQMLDAAKHFVSYTSGFTRFKLVNGKPVLENYQPNYCYPNLDDSGELIDIEIKYVYETEEYDAKSGKMICRWYKLYMDREKDILYDNPVYDENGAEPEFVEESRNEHNLGFVQGEWARWGENQYDVDGNQIPLTLQIQGFIDSINYNLSQSDSATSYGLDPQLAIKGMTEDEVELLIKSSQKAWLTGREGEAKFLEVAGSGLQRAKETEDRMMKRAADAARIVFLDPEKMAANAQSGKAMEIMNAPMVELVNELRPWFEKFMQGLLQKMMATIILYGNAGFEIGYNVPEGYEPESMEIDCSWPPVYELTIQDMQQIVSVAIQASNANIIARDTAAKWAQKMGVDFGVEDWDAEVAKINGQQQFGGFF